MGAKGISAKHCNCPIKQSCQYQLGGVFDASTYPALATSWALVGRPPGESLRRSDRRRRRGMHETRKFNLTESPLGCAEFYLRGVNAAPYLRYVGGHRLLLSEKHINNALEVMYLFSYTKAILQMHAFRYLGSY